MVVQQREKPLASVVLRFTHHRTHLPVSVGLTDEALRYDNIQSACREAALWSQERWELEVHAYFTCQGKKDWRVASWRRGEKLPA